MFYPHSSALGSVMSGDFASLSAQDSQQKALLLFKQTQSPLLPVVDKSGKLLGVVAVPLQCPAAKAGWFKRLRARFANKK